MNQIEPASSSLVVENGSGLGRPADNNINFNVKYLQCWRCSCWIRPEQLVFRIPVNPESPDPSTKAVYYYYHMDCFNCLICHCPLRKGQMFGLRSDSGSIYCHQHYPPPPPPRPPTTNDGRGKEEEEEEKKIVVVGSSINQKQVSPLVSEILGKPAADDNLRRQPSMDRSQHDSNENDARKQRNSHKPFQKRNHVSNEGSHNRLLKDHHHHHFEGSSSSMNHHENSMMMMMRFEENPPPPPKRIRTSFKKFQLQLLRKCFQQTHKPNSLEMACLIERTGLSKRVLQIWFQNQRSKWSRYVLARPKSGPLTVGPSGPVEQLFSVNLRFQHEDDLRVQHESVEQSVETLI